MAAFVFVTVYDTHMCRKKQKRQKFKKPNVLTGKRNSVLKKIIMVFAR